MESIDYPTLRPLTLSLTNPTSEHLPILRHRRTQYAVRRPPTGPLRLKDPHLLKLYPNPGFRIGNPISGVSPLYQTPAEYHDDVQQSPYAERSLRDMRKLSLNRPTQ
jgi:hypothetical protein